MEKGSLLSHLSSSFGPPTSGETLYSFLRMGKESKERGWALVEFLAQINNDERDSQRRMEAIIVLQWALLSGIPNLEGVLGLLEYAWDRTRKTIKRYKKVFILNQWSIQAPTNKRKITNNKSNASSLRDGETSSDDEIAENGKTLNTPYVANKCSVRPVRKKRPRKDRQSFDVCSELTRNRSLLSSPLIDNTTMHVNTYLEPQNSPRVTRNVSNEPLQSPSRVSYNAREEGQSEVVTDIITPKDPSQAFIVFDPDEPNLWNNINTIIFDANKVSINFDDDQQSCLSSESSMMYATDESINSIVSGSSSGGDHTDDRKSQSSSSEKMLDKHHNLRRRKRISTKADRQMRKTNRIKDCERWRIILQGNISGKDVNVSKNAAAKVLKTFKKRMEKANDGLKIPEDSKTFEEANTQLQKLSRQLSEFLKIFTFTPTAKQLNARFDEIFEQQVNQKKKRITALRETKISSNKKQITLEIPATHAVVLRKDLTRFIQGNHSFNKLIATVQSAKKYTGGETGKRILAGALAMEPQMSMRGMELIVGASIASMFADAGIKIDSDKVALNVPSANTIKAMMVNLAAEVVLKLQETLRGVSKVYLSCDKGHRKGIDNFIKILSFWSNEKNEVENILLDLDGSGPSSKDCAEAIGHSLEKLEGAVLQLSGQTTDSGGGGTLESLRKELGNLNLITPEYLVANCTLHAQQIFMSEPTEKVFGTGGLGRRNVIQMIHSAYSLHRCYEFQEFKKLWNEINKQQDEDNGDIKKMQEPVTTRWWYMGLAAAFFLKYWNAFLSFCVSVINNETTEKAANKIASALYSLMNEPELESDLIFIVAYHHYFMTPHFKFLQQAGDRSKKPGYQANNILVRYYLMYQDIETLKENGWKSQKKFENFNKSLETLTNEQSVRQTNKANMFINLVQQKLKTYINRWANELFMACLGSEKETAQRAALLLVADDFSNIINSETRQRSFISEVHSREIELDSFSSFISKFCKDKEKICRSESFQQNADAINLIAFGANLWSVGTNRELNNFREFYCKTFLPLASNTQHVENFVKEASLVSETGLTEKMRSVLAMLHSSVARPVAREYKESAKNRLLSANQHCTGGLKGQRQMTSTEQNDEDIRSNPIGAPRTTEFLSYMEKFNKDCEGQENQVGYKEKIDRIKEQLISDKCQFSEKRHAKKLDAFKKSQEKPKALNKSQLARGVDHTPLTLGRIQYGQLGKANIAALKMELRMRDIHFEESLNVTGLKKLLKEHELKRLESDAAESFKSSFEPMTQWIIDV